MISHLFHSTKCPFNIIAIPKSTHSLKIIYNQGQRGMSKKKERQIAKALLAKAVLSWQTSFHFKNYKTNQILDVSNPQDLNILHEFITAYTVW